MQFELAQKFFFVSVCSLGIRGDAALIRLGDNSGHNLCRMRPSRGSKVLPRSQIMMMMMGVSLSTKEQQATMISKKMTL